jgi:hypothetical protein
MQRDTMQQSTGKVGVGEVLWHPGVLYPDVVKRRSRDLRGMHNILSAQLGRHRVEQCAVTQQSASHVETAHSFTASTINPTEERRVRESIRIKKRR